MITTQGIRETEGVRWTRQKIELEHVEIECDVMVVSVWNGDGFNHRFDAMPTRFSIDGTWFTTSEQAADMQATMQLLATRYIGEYERDILDRVF
jgi:hypothetical protein